MLVAEIHALIHFFGIDYGAPYGKWVPYSFWSGVAGTALVTAPFVALVFYWHHTCHASPWCLRWGKHPAAGGLYKLCRHHHPDMRHRKRRHTLGDIDAEHRAWKAGQ